jgi:hypothetical protein
VLPPWYRDCVADVCLAALLDARPTGPFWGRSWVEEVLDRHLLPSESALMRLKGWSIGASVGSETFVQSRPIVRDRDADPIDDLLRTPAPCTLAAFTVGGNGDDVGEATHGSVVLRFRRFVAVRSGDPLDAGVRAALRADVPDFIARSEGVASDGDLVFHRFLAALHAAGALGAAYAPGEAFRAALRTIDASLGATSHCLMVTDGRTLGVVHRGGMLLSFEPPAEATPPRTWRVEDTTRPTARASLLAYLPGPPPDAPVGAAERIAEGIFTIEPARPRVLTRDPG